MQQSPAADVLTQWAKALREEGDIETADAIERQLQESAPRALDDAEAARLRRLLARARRCDSAGAYAAAADIYAEALHFIEASFGKCSPEILGHLNDVARCRLNAGQNSAARDAYAKLLRLVESLYGRDDALAGITRQQLGTCETAIRAVACTRRLHSTVDHMVRCAQGQRLFAAAARADRQRAAALRLAARGRCRTAARLHEASIALRMRGVRPDDEAALLEIQRQALELKDAGDPARAAAVLLRVAVMRNRQSGRSDQSRQLRSVLEDAAACLAAQGSRRSADEARALADKMKVPTGEAKA